MLDTEDVFDNENDDNEVVKEFALSYGSVSMQAILHDKQYEEQLRSESSEDLKQTIIQGFSFLLTLYFFNLTCFVT